MDKDVEMGVVNEDKASRPLLDTPEMAETQPDQEKPGLDSSQKVEPEEARKKKNQETTEKEINDALEKGNLKDIKKYVTPEKLTECTKNCIEKSFEVSHELKILGKSKRSEARKFNDFATQVEDFAYHMLEPLEKDDVKRAVFKEILFDDVSDKAIKLRQKKFVSHPVYSQMMRQRWNGDFYELKHCNVKKNLFKWALINFWTLFDMFLFPLAHILLWAINKISEFVKKEDTFLIFAFWEGMKKIRIVDDIMSSQAGDSPRRMEELEMCKNGEDVFLDYLEKAKKTFQKEKKKTNKVLVVMTDDKLIGSKRKDFLEAVRSLKKKQNVKVISVGLIYLAHLRHHCTHFEDLETMATNDENVFLTFERDDEMKDKILKCIAGKNIFERYVQYFKTPYFIFIRDTLSYLVLLGLHIAMCLQPSTLHFTAIEWIISVFFLGRFLTEMDLVIWEEEKEEKEEKEEEESKGSKSNAAEAKAGSKNEEEEDRLRKKLWKIISAYFDDWWNKIDIVTLIVFLVLIGFRIFTWSQHSSISKNRLLAFAGYLYGLNAMFLSLRVFGHIMENNKATGSIQIALFHVMGAILIILGQFLVSTLAFSLAITKIYIAEASYSSGRNETFSG